MLTAGLAQRYAKALLGAVAAGEAVEKTAAELKMVLQTCAGHKDLNACLNSAIVAPAAKRNIIADMFAARIGTLTVNFLLFLIEKHRFGLLGAISAALDELIEEMRGIARVSIVSPFPVRDSERDYFRRRLEKWLKQSVRLCVDVNPALLCGLQIRVGDQLFDGSGLGRLTQMRDALSAF